MREERTWWVTDGEGDCLRLYGNPENVAQEYVDGGSWGEIQSTEWVDVHIYDVEPGHPDFWNRLQGTVTVALHPREPTCENGEEHDWGRPHAIVGGLRENPGVWGHGGGTRGVDVCARCALMRHWDNWAQRGDTGEQGLYSVRYEQEE